MGDIFSKPNDSIAVLFDFDGTIGDTETPAMKIAFWELAAYFTSAEVSGKVADETSYVQNNAGKAFEFMVEACEEERKNAGLKSIAEVRSEYSHHPTVLQMVNSKRKEFGLKDLEQVKNDNGGALPDICLQQKEETNIALATMAHPNPGVPEVLASLAEKHIPFCIATTSPKPRVPISITSCGFDNYFPAHKVHSGESDFNPPMFKPDPAVYLKAAKAERTPVDRCIAVEDSASGVGSAANAKLGLIIGYVGSSHIPAHKKDDHAKQLMAGKRSEDGRGADVVVTNFTDILCIIETFKDDCEKIKNGEELDPLPKRLKALKSQFTAKSWFP